MFAQTECAEDSIRYLSAYKYISQEQENICKNRCIAVSDSIVDLNRYLFINDLAEYPDKKNDLIQYRIKKGYSWFETYRSNCLNFLFIQNDSCTKKVLFFSHIENDILVAEIFLYSRNKQFTKIFNKFNYDWVSFQNKSRIYLFIFDKNGKITFVVNKKMIYN